MTIEVGNTILLFPIGNMIGDVVAFKSVEISVGNKVVLFPCEITEGFEYVVACKPLSIDSICLFARGTGTVVVPIRGNKEYVVALKMAGEELPLQFTEPWEVYCESKTLQFTEIWEDTCSSRALEFTEGWES